MRSSVPESVSRLVDSFQRAHAADLPSLNVIALQRRLEQVYGEVLEGKFLARTEEQLKVESEECGIDRKDYEALVNLSAHAAGERPLT